MNKIFNKYLLNINIEYLFQEHIYLNWLNEIQINWFIWIYEIFSAY